MSSAPGWSADPAGRHQLRFWNGDSWTDHVSDNGVRSTDPLSVNGPRIFVDATIPLIGGKRLYADDQGVSWAGRSVAYHEVKNLAYWVEVPLRGPDRTYEIRLRLRKGAMKIRFSGRTEYVRTAYDGLMAGLLEHVGRPMITDVLNRIEAGESVEFGGWTLSREAASYGRKKVPWSTSTAIRENKTENVWWVHGIAEGKKKDIGMTGVQRDDGPLVRQVIQECIRRYGG